MPCNDEHDGLGLGALLLCAFMGGFLGALVTAAVLR